MRLSYKWLSEYVDLHDIDVQTLADRLTSSGLEVEGIEPLARGTNLVVGYVEQCEAHPDSDHLHVCQVNLGKEVTQIVCGAPNVAQGQKVIVARVGASLPQLTIKAGNIRGQASNGMICSLLELGVDGKYLSDESKNGIEILGDDAVIGDENPLAYLGLDDVILDIGLTPNRNDCMAMFAMAKEVGAILNRKTRLPKYTLPTEELPASLRVGSNSQHCSVFLGKYIGRIAIKESPKWMQERLHASGIKSINNVVDISNYVMLETGQPLHFYDGAKIPAKEITVQDGFTTTYRALDGIDYDILPEDLMITTAGNCIGIAGVMGGDDSKIDDQTTSLIIEVASFHPVTIRNTARRLHLGTEASSRYQKGIEPLAPEAAMSRAVQLLVELADASALEETVVYRSAKYEPTKIDVSLTFINKRLGTTFAMEEVEAVLSRLQFAPQVDGDMIHVTIPSYRTDITIPDDISEEVIRILGYDRLESTLPRTQMTLGKLSERQTKKRMMERTLMASGLTQAITYTLVSERNINSGVMALKDAVALASPMSEDRKFVRSSVLPSLLESANYNVSRFQSDVNLFEISNVYANNLVQERLAIVMVGQIQSLAWKKWSVNSDFYTLKGILSAMLTKLGFDGTRVFIKENTVDVTNFHPKQSAALYLGRDLLGVFGTIHPLVRKQYDLKSGIMAELNLDVLWQAKASKVKFTAIPKFPSIKRDLAFVVDKKVEVKKMMDAIAKVNKSLIQDVQIFDIYEGEHVGANEKSVALSVIYHSMEKTLTDQEISVVHEQILSVLKKEFNAVLRS